MNGRIIKKNVNSYLVELDDHKLINAISLKKNKYNNKQIIVGDKVNIELMDNNYLIDNIYKRKNLLNRPKVANVDILIIIQSVIEPDLSIFQLNKYLLFYELNNIDKIIIYFSKMDLLNKNQLNEMENIIDKYAKDYFCLRSDKEDDLHKLNNLIINNVICFVGESGVGKSTLINKIVPELNLNTNAISKALNRGKHTTTNASLIKFNQGYFVDTPGFGNVEFNCSDIELAQGFKEFKELSSKCKFRNCLHNKEIGCAVIESVNQNKTWDQKYQSYLKILNENQKNRIKY